MAKKKKMMLIRERPISFSDGKWHYERQKFEVIVMSVVDGWAMVRRPRCVPFVERADLLHELPRA